MPSVRCAGRLGATSSARASPLGVVCTRSLPPALMPHGCYCGTVVTYKNCVSHSLTASITSLARKCHNWGGSCQSLPPAQLTYVHGKLVPAQILYYTKQTESSPLQTWYGAELACIGFTSRSWPVCHPTGSSGGRRSWHCEEAHD